jgi:hypothetical protein
MTGRTMLCLAARLQDRIYTQKTKLNSGPETASKVYRPSDSRLLAMLVLTFVDRRCHMVSVTDPYGRILGSLDRSS